MFHRLCILAVACCAVHSQPAAPAFEVAAISYVGPYDGDRDVSMRGGPGTSEPTRVTYENVTLVNLLSRAYGVDFDQISGPPWLASLQYTVIANVPAGAAREDLPLMWQRLLRERFHVAVHHEVKDVPGYALVVAKGGPKLQPSKGNPGEAQPGQRPTKGADGFPILPPGARHFPWLSNENGERVTRETFRDFTMQELAQELAIPLGQRLWEHFVSVGRIVDKTGLQGKYDFRLEYAGTHSPGGAFPPPRADGQPRDFPDLLDAVERQLGLKIEASKIPIDTLVVDRVDKMATAN